MPEQKISEERMSPTWLLIMDRLKVTDLAGWIAQHRRAPRGTPGWLSWEAIARLISTQTGVPVTANGVRARWSDEVDALVIRAHAADQGGELPDVPVPPTEAAGSTGPAGALGSEAPAGSNPGDGTR